MNAIERITATLQGAPTDRRAICLILSHYGARLTDCPLERFFTDPAAYARGQSAVFETFQVDFLFSPLALALFGEAFGSELRSFHNLAPNVIRPAIPSAGEIDQLAVPDIDSHPRLLFLRETIRLMAAAHGHQIPIAAIALSPMNLPTLILGFDVWMETVLFDPDGTRRVLQKMIPFCVRWANAVLADGAGFVALPTTFVNPSIVTRQIAAEIAIPAFEETFAQINGPIVLHSGGTPLSGYLDLFAGLPNVVGIVLNEKDSFAEAREQLGPKMVLLGNVEGVSLAGLRSEQVLEECRTVLLDRQADPYFALGSATGDIPYDTPAENIHAFGRAAEAFANGRNGGVS